MTEPLLPSAEPPRDRRPVLGYTMVAVAATLFGVNGPVSKVALSSGLSSPAADGGAIGERPRSAGVVLCGIGLAQTAR